MKYLCLIYDDESKRGTLPKEQLDTMMGEYGAFTEGIKKSGHYIGDVKRTAGNDCQVVARD